MLILNFVLSSWFVSMALSAYCSNDTRTGLPYCEGDTTIQCFTNKNNLYCDGTYARSEITENRKDKSKFWKTVCTDGEYKNYTKRKEKGKSVFLSTAKCLYCFSNPEKCAGDYNYCQVNDCATFSDCSCVTKFGNVTWKKTDVVSGPEVTHVNISVSLIPDYIEDVIPLSYDNGNFENDGSYEYTDFVPGILHDYKRFQSDATVHWIQPVLDIYLQDWENCTLWLDKGSKSMKKDFESSSINMEVDTTWLRDPDSIIMRIYKNDGALKVYSDSLLVDAIVRCDIPSKIASAEFRAAFSCLPDTLQGIFVGFWLLIAISTCLAFALMIIMIKNSCNGPMQFNLTMSDASKTVLLMSMMCCVASGCDYSLSISSQNLICSDMGNGEQSCSMMLTTLATLPHPGFLLCYDVTDVVSGTVFGKIKITLQESLVTAPMSLRYYTGLWTKHICADKWCPNSQGCGSDDNCQTFATWTGTKQANADNKLTGTCPLYPGRTTCMSSCGCAGCGCVFCSDSCTYMRWALKTTSSTSNVYSVYQPGSFTRRNKLSICWYQDNVDKCSTGYIQNNLATSFGSNFTMAILGNLEGSTIVPPASHVTINVNNGKSYFVNAAAAGTPTKNQWGDVQGSSASSFTSPSRTSFSFDSTTCSCAPSGSGASCTCSSSAVSSKLSGLKVTNGTYNDFIYSVSQNQYLTAIDPRPGNTLVQIDAPNVNFTRRVSEVCPSLEYVGSGGAHSDDSYPWLSIMAHSTCLEGSCVLYGTDINITSPALTLKTVEQNFIVRFSSMKREFAGKLCCKSYHHTTCIDVSGVLEDPILNVGNDTNNGGANPGSVTDWWGSLSLGGKIGFFVGIIGGVLLLLAIMSTLVYFSVVKSWSFPTKSGYSKVDDKNEMVDDEEMMELSEESEAI